MVGTEANGRTRMAFSVVNGGQNGCMESTPTSLAGSDYGGVEFSREDVEALLNEKLKRKDRFNLKVSTFTALKEKCDNMAEYIKRLKLCIKWFQGLESAYLLEQERLLDRLESDELKCSEMEILLENKEEELNLIIVELRKSIECLQEKFTMEESDKLVAMDSLVKEKEARQNIERSQASIVEELGRAQRDLSSANQKITSLNDMYKRLQEYITSLQQYNGKLHTELSTVEDDLKRIEKEKASMVENLSLLKGQLTLSKASHDDAVKQKEEMVEEVSCLRRELQQVRDDRDRQLSQVQSLTVEVIKYKESAETCNCELEILKTKTSELEETCSWQNNELKAMNNHLSVAESKLQVSDLSAIATKAEFEEQKRLIIELQNRLDDAETKLTEGEKLRKKLHNTILELKGNIRVFCRVRPLIPEDGFSLGGKIFSYPSSVEALGRGIEVMQNGQRHSFTFDKVFMPTSTQEDVFVEISQLVQSALDGYKVCIFAYGQTGSGKTYTMMGGPGLKELRGLIPRSLEQIFQARQSLQPQGWKYEMQVSMLEIYNENIRDLLGIHRSNSDSSRLENCSPGKQYAIKHDVSGNTHVSELTVVDVRSVKEVSFLLDQAARSRSVGKTQMNEESSRSHFVFTLRIFGVNESTDQQVQGVLNLIDLAGSERLSKSGSTGDRLKETQAINKSLSSLSDVIFALAKKEEHVPFRNSKLTYLLQPCLGGDSKTLMFVNISPDPSSLGESLCSLRFAARVNACEIGTPRRQTNSRQQIHADLRYS